MRRRIMLDDVRRDPSLCDDWRYEEQLREARFSEQTPDGIFEISTSGGEPAESVVEGGDHESA